MPTIHTKLRVFSSILLLVPVFVANSIGHGHSAEREWHEGLWFVKSGEAKENSAVAYVQIEEGKAVIRFGSRSDVDPEKLPAEANQRFTQSEYRLVWGNEWPAVIRFEVRRKDIDKPTTQTSYYLSIVDPKTAPRLELTPDISKANRWTMEPIRTEDRVKTEAPQIKYWGYIRATDVPGLDLWLGVSSEPILKNEPPFRKGFNIKVVDFRQLSVSAKKEHIFRFSRSIPDGK
jgi:hypothetical protein